MTDFQKVSIMDSQTLYDKNLWLFLEINKNDK